MRSKFFTLNFFYFKIYSYICIIVRWSSGRRFGANPIKQKLCVIYRFKSYTGTDVSD